MSQLEDTTSGISASSSYPRRKDHAAQKKKWHEKQESINDGVGGWFLFLLQGVTRCSIQTSRLSLSTFSSFYLSPSISRSLIEIRSAGERRHDFQIDKLTSALESKHALQNWYKNDFLPDYRIRELISLTRWLLGKGSLMICCPTAAYTQRVSS